MGRSSKVFWDERSRKLGRKKKRIKRHKRINNNKNNKVKHYSNQEWCLPDYIINVPESFSFTSNLNETVTFFYNMMIKLKNAYPKKVFLIESRNVKNVTTDAIMYLIALMKNCKISRDRMYSFEGTYPIDQNAKKIYMESGLLNFVKSKAKKLPENNSKMSIMSGRNNNSVSAGAICNFISEKLNATRIYVKEIYEVIVEMMSNVYYHAYSIDEEFMVPEWFMYAEYVNDEINFLFLDTGLGIGKTVKKNSLYEKVINKIGIINDSKLIRSTLDGDFRTQTGKSNHGKGMPFISDFAKKDKVTNFHIISGSGHCWLNDSTVNFQSEELKNKINGTIYIFTIKNWRQSI